jgi:REP element-mobilizing transposase RayT
MPSKYDPKKHHRRSIRLPGYDYTLPGGYYITIVTHDRACLFGEVVDGEMVLNDLGKIAQREWERLAKRFKNVRLGVFVIMPNHAHGVILIIDNRPGMVDSTGKGTADSGRCDNLQAPRRALTAMPTHEAFGKPVSGSIPTIVRSYKSAVSLRIGYARRNDKTPVWQRNYYEHVIRDMDDANRICDYIESNPATWEDDDENPARAGAR